MEKELRNPPAIEVPWSFVHQEGEGFGFQLSSHRAMGRTAWQAVKSLKLSFQNCHSFVQEGE